MKAHRILMLCVLALSLGIAAEVLSEGAPPMTPKTPNGMSAIGAPQAQPTPAGASMEQMAKAMSGMAQVCQVMMRREMRQDAAIRPVAIGLGGVIAILLALALAALVALEIQWIRLAGIRIRNERAQPRSS
jgi:hypothetical protein